MKWMWLIVLVVLVGCKSGGSDKVTSSSTPAKPGAYTSCKYDEDLELYAHNLVLINSSSITQTIKYFEESDCRTGPTFSESYIYSYTRSGTTFNLTYESAVVTSHDSNFTAAFNSLSFCDEGAWQNNRPVDILDKDCEGVYIAKGESFTSNITSSGSSITVKSEGVNFTYRSINGLNFSAHGQNIADGDYIYSNGAYAMHISITGSNYQSHLYNPVTKEKIVETGTLNGSNNTVNITVSSYSQSCPEYDPDIGETSTSKFSLTDYTMALRSGTSDVIFEKTNITYVDFENKYLGSGFSAGCP